MTDFTPKPSQAADLEQLRANDYTGLLNIQTGYGKTIVSCMAAKDSGANVVLIIAPLSTHRSAWKKDVKLVTGQDVKPIGNKNKEQRNNTMMFNLGFPGYYIVGPQLFTRTDITTWSGDMLIVDEVHMLGNPGSTGQRRLSGYDLSKDDEPLSMRFKHRLALSATPARNNFVRMWSVMRLLWPELRYKDQVAYDNHWAWKQDRMESKVIYTGRNDRFGNRETATQWLTEQVPGMLINEAPCVIQHFKYSKCCEFHPNGFSETMEPEPIERDIFLLPEQKKIIKDLEEQSVAWLQENPLIVDMPLIMHQRLRQVALGVPKIDYEEVTVDGVTEVKAIVNYDLDCKSPVIDQVIHEAEVLDDAPFVVYLESQKFAHVLTHRLNEAGISAAQYSGKVKADLEGFGRDYRCLVGVLSAVGTGTDGLQKVASDEIWIQRSLDNVLNEQGEGRLDRTGQEHNVTRIFIQDDLDMFKGQLSSQITKQLELNRSLRKAA